jgi:hypothetical protein
VLEISPVGLLGSSEFSSLRERALKDPYLAIGDFFRYARDFDVGRLDLQVQVSQEQPGKMSISG